MNLSCILYTTHIIRVATIAHKFSALSGLDFNVACWLNIQLTRSFIATQKQSYLHKTNTHLQPQKIGREWTNRDKRKTCGENSNGWNIWQEKKNVPNVSWLITCWFFLVLCDLPKEKWTQFMFFLRAESTWFCYIFKSTRESPDANSTHANKVRSYEWKFHLNTKCIMWKMNW